jgi:hypothetical protein
VVDAHGAPAARIYGGVEAPTDRCVRLSRTEAEPLRGGSRDPRWGWAAPRRIRGTCGPNRGLRPTVGERTGRMSWSLCSTSSSARGVCRCEWPSGRSRQIGSPPISAMLDHVARPTFRTRADGEDLLSPDRLVFRGRRALSSGGPGAGRAGPPCNGPPKERGRSRAGVLRPPPGLPHPKAAISASAA